MTEIKIEKKKAAWPWILLVLAVLAIILYFVFSNGDDNNMAAVTDTDTTEAVTPGNNSGGAVAGYIAFVRNDTGRMSLDHNYSSTAITKLVQAVEAKAAAIGYDVKTDLGDATAYANQITQEPYETSHADKIRKVADMASTALGNMQRAKYPSLNMEANNLQSAAADIKPDVLTLDQKTAVQNFYDKAANLLEKMN